VEVTVSDYEEDISKDGVSDMLDYLWEANEKSYTTLKMLVEPDTNEVIISLPPPRDL